MPITGPHTTTAGDPRNLEAGLLLLAAGAIVLLISLFLEWYEPGIEAWDVFEVWDIVLAAVAIAALVAVAGRMGFGPPRPASWLIGSAAVAFVVVVMALIDHPPAANGTGNDPTTGIWLALIGSALMLAGAILSVARISVALNVGDARPAGPRRGRFGRGGGVVDPDPAVPPVVPGTPPTEPTRRL